MALYNTRQLLRSVRRDRNLDIIIYLFAVSAAIEKILLWHRTRTRTKCAREQIISVFLLCVSNSDKSSKIATVCETPLVVANVCHAFVLFLDSSS